MIESAALARADVGASRLSWRHYRHDARQVQRRQTERLKLRTCGQRSQLARIVFGDVGIAVELVHDRVKAGGLTGAVSGCAAQIARHVVGRRANVAARIAIASGAAIAGELVAARVPGDDVRLDL